MIIRMNNRQLILPFLLLLVLHGCHSAWSANEHRASNSASTNERSTGEQWWKENEWQAADSDYTHSYTNVGGNSNWKERPQNVQADSWSDSLAEGSGASTNDEWVEGSGDGFGVDDEDSLVAGSGDSPPTPDVNVPWTNHDRVNVEPPILKNSPRPIPPPETQDSWWSESDTRDTFVRPNTPLPSTTTSTTRTTTTTTTTTTTWMTTTTTEPYWRRTTTTTMSNYDPFSWSTAPTVEQRTTQRSLYPNTPISSPDDSIYEQTPDSRDTMSPRRRLRELFNRPGIWAAVIGGAVVGILVAVTLVCFIIYRMRKKDEGSYALDESSSPGQYGYAYSKAPTKEFYA